MQLTSGRSGRHLTWLVLVLLLVSFALMDALVVGWYAGITSLSEAFAGCLTFALVSAGLIVTVWKLDRKSK